MSCQYEAAEDNLCSSVIVCYLYCRWTSNCQRGLISHQLIYLRHFIVPVQSLDFQRHMMLYLIMYNVLRWYDVIVRFLGIGGIVKLLFIISFQNLCAWIWNLINQITIFNMRHTFLFFILKTVVRNMLCVCPLVVRYMLLLFLLLFIFLCFEQVI
jgi:hypothetical protein